MLSYLANPLRFMRFSRLAVPICFALGAIMIGWSLYNGLLVVPPDEKQGGDLMRAGDPASMRSLALLTLATYSWEGHETRAEAALERMFMERGQVYAGFLAGLMLSDERGPADRYRARAYLRDAANAGSSDAEAFLGLFDACHGRAIAFN